jgi:hypothetical protein
MVSLSLLVLFESAVQGDYVMSHLFTVIPSFGHRHYVMSCLLMLFKAL